MGPKVGASAKDIPYDTQFLLVEIEENKQYALMLPLVDNGFRATLHHDNNDDAASSSNSIGIVCTAESGDCPGDVPRNEGALCGCGRRSL
jgi:raffinose synthase